MTTLYRLYGAGDELLYVGITVNFSRRLRQHEVEKHWFPQVVRHQCEDVATRALTLERETAAILTERPKYNILTVAAGGPKAESDSKRKHFMLPEPYRVEMERRAAGEGWSESKWVAVHIMNAIDSGAPAVRVRKADGP